MTSIIRPNSCQIETACVSSDRFASFDETYLEALPLCEFIGGASPRGTSSKNCYGYTILVQLDFRS